MRYLVAAYVCLVLVSSVHSQQTPPSVQRDTQAIAILNQSLAAAGGLQAISAIQTITATGTITYYWAGQDVQGSVNIYGKGLAQFRMDANLPDGMQSFIVSGPTGVLIHVDGRKESLSPHCLMTAGALSLPASRVAAALTDSSTKLTYGGVVTWNGSTAYKVHVAPPVDPALTLNRTLKGLGEYDLLLDRTTYTILALWENIWWGSDLTQSYSHEIIFSNYSPVSGIVAPFAITEKFGGQQTWSASLTSLTFNGSVSDTYFDF